MNKRIATYTLAWVTIILLITNTLYAQTTVNVKFSVDMSLLVSQGKFNPSADRILIKGSFNNWGSQNQLNREGTTTIYSVNLNLNANTFHDYKFFITTAGAANGGWESSPGFGTNGNRTLNTGTNPLVLPVVFFDNGDISLKLTTEHFNFSCTSQDNGILADFANKLETEYSRIVNSLQATITQKIEVVIYRNLDAYHNAIGYPEFPTWAVGSARGKTTIQLASPNHAGTTTYAGMLQVVVHEFVHITEAWKATVALPIWLNEGVATWFANQTPVRTYVRSLINGFGGMPQLSLFEDFNTFGNIGGYDMSYTIAEFLVNMHGLDKLAGFVQTVSYSGLGYANKTAFQNAWHTYLTNNYINTPPPVITIGAIRRFGETWFINYSPYPEKDADGNTITYYITVTGEGFTKTYTDTGHSGGFSIARSDLKADATYTVAAKSWDGITYTLTSKTKTFITANIPPTLFAFTAPGNGQTAGYDPEHRIRLAWSPVQAVDTDGDSVTDRITVETNGQGKTWEIPGGTGFLQLDSADLLPGRSYTIRGERTDGTDTVAAVPVTFNTSDLSGINDPAALTCISLFPVPARNVVNISAELDGPVTIDLQIYSGTGQLMHKSRHPVQGYFKTGIDISDFPPGIYVMRLGVSDGRGISFYRTRKIVVDRGQ